METTKDGQGAGMGRNRAVVVALGASLGLWGVAPWVSLGQNALGDGRALDNNLQQGSGGRNQGARDFRGELALRNAIVTGNVGGGKSFRGDVGYTAADDFRGSLGSNDLFIANREAAYSGLAAQNLRGLNALQFQMGQSTAGMTHGLGGDLIVRRSGTGLDSGAVTGAPNASDTASIDPYGHMRQALRSTSEFMVRSSAYPRVLGTVDGSVSGTVMVTGSALQGIKTMSLSNSALGLRPGESEFERFGKLNQFSNDAGETAKARGADEDEDLGGMIKPISKPLEFETAHSRLLKEMQQRQEQFRPTAVSERLGSLPPEDAAKDGTKKGSTPGLNDPESQSERVPRPGTAGDPDGFEARLEDLRREFEQDTMLPWQRDEQRLKESRNKQRMNAEAQRQGAILDPTDILATDAERDGVATGVGTSNILESARELLGSNAAAIETLIAEEGTSDLYTVHMRRGESLLKEEQWFAAEERFGAALRVRPGDAMAAAGRVSAEIGAGLYRSAVVNVRTMLMAYPELLQTQLKGKMFPSGDRLQRIRAQLRIRSERDTPLARDAGFLLAYVGSQTGNEEDLREGFAVMDRVDKALNLNPDKLEEVARGLWTGR